MNRRTSLAACPSSGGAERTPFFPLRRGLPKTALRDSAGAFFEDRMANTRTTTRARQFPDTTLEHSSTDTRQEPASSTSAPVFKGTSRRNG